MENTRKVIISIAAVVVIIIIIIITMMISLNQNKITTEQKTGIRKEQEEYLNIIENPASVVNGKKPELVKLENIYFCAENAIDRFVSYIEEKNLEAIISVLDYSYVESKNINANNILSKEFITEISNEINIQDMYSLDGSNYTIFYVKGNIDMKEIFLTVNMDFASKTFSIIPSNKEEYEEKITTVVNGKTGQEEKIQKNNYNMLVTSNLKQDEIANKYLMDLKEKLINKPEEVYKLLDEEYKDKRFKDLSDFKEYVQENIQNINNMMLTKYSVDAKDGYTEYLCVDNNQNNYLFKVTSAMKYKVLLDNYTVVTEQYKEEYESSSESDKIATNIDKFIRCINNKDYNQAYSFLDEGFKNNYFSDVSSFEEYIKDNFYNYNSMGKIDIKNEGNIFICTVSIKSGIGVGASNMTKTIIMQLKEGTDFEMSFNIE